MQNGGGLHIDNMIRQRDKNLVQDVKVIRNEPCIPQHKLMVCKFFPKEKEKGKKTIFVSKYKIWKLKVAETQKEYEKKVYDREEKRDRNEEDVEAVWKELKGCLLEVAEEICGSTKGPPRHKESWWPSMVHGRSQEARMKRQRKRNTNRLIPKQKMMRGEL